MAKKIEGQESMYRKEFVAALAGRLDVSKKDAGKITDAFLDVLKETWSGGRSICFPGLGVFELHVISEKMGRNPKTMEKHLVPAGYKPAFRPTKELRAFITRRVTENWNGLNDGGDM